MCGFRENAERTTTKFLVLSLSPILSPLSSVVLGHFLPPKPPHHKMPLSTRDTLAPCVHSCGPAVLSLLPVEESAGYSQAGLEVQTSWKNLKEVQAESERGTDHKEGLMCSSRVHIFSSHAQPAPAQPLLCRAFLCIAKSWSILTW